MKVMKRLLKGLWSWLKPYLTPRMIPIILTIWVITNGVWYVMAFAPLPFFPSWLKIFSRGYLAFLWLPFSAEKPIIIFISVFLYRFIYKEKFNKKIESQGGQ